MILYLQKSDRYEDKIKFSAVGIIGPREAKWILY